MTIRERILRLLRRDYNLRTATEVAHALRVQPSTTSSLLCRMAKTDEVLRIKGQRRGRWAWYYMALDHEGRKSKYLRWRRK